MVISKWWFLTVVRCMNVIINEGRDRYRRHTAFLTVASAVMIPAAATLAVRVPKGSHFKIPILPSPRPFTRAKNHLIHTPRGPTMQPNQSWASLLPLLNSFFSSSPLKLHKPPNSSIIIIVATSWRGQVSTLHLQPESATPLAELVSCLWRSHLNPLAVSIPKMME